MKVVNSSEVKFIRNSIFYQAVRLKERQLITGGYLKISLLHSIFEILHHIVPDEYLDQGVQLLLLRDLLIFEDIQPQNFGHMSIMFVLGEDLVEDKVNLEREEVSLALIGEVVWHARVGEEVELGDGVDEQREDQDERDHVVVALLGQRQKTEWQEERYPLLRAKVKEKLDGEETQLELVLVGPVEDDGAEGVGGGTSVVVEVHIEQDEEGVDHDYQHEMHVVHWMRGLGLADWRIRVFLARPLIWN